ncbi:unnamed protein product [Coregonus sp. 'balchen']|nr:unnamed protein product [Coregonus sp. 'balchen']
MEQFNPGLRNLVNLGKSYEKSVAAMSLAGKVYFDAVSKIGENAAVSPVSRELGKFITYPLVGEGDGANSPSHPNASLKPSCGALAGL